jgi:ribosomal protein L40E
MKLKIFSATICILFVAMFFLPVGQALESTSITLSPDNFNVETENSLTFTATLTSGGSPLSGKTILFTTSGGTFTPMTGLATTGSDGKATITYAAPVISLDNQPVTVTATFAWDFSYWGSSNTVNGTIDLLASTSLSISPSSFTLTAGESQTFTATLTSGGAPVQGKTIFFSKLWGTVDPISGTTDSQGNVSTNYASPSIVLIENETIGATFLGDWDYESSTANVSGVIQNAATENAINYSWDNHWTVENLLEWNLPENEPLITFKIRPTIELNPSFKLAAGLNWTSLADSLLQGVGWASTESELTTTVGLDIEFEATLPAGWGIQLDQNVELLNGRFDSWVTVPVGPIPVPMKINPRLYLGVKNITSENGIHASAKWSGTATSTIGFSYDTRTGGVLNKSENMEMTIDNLDVGGDIEITPYLKPEIDFLLGGVAGPLLNVEFRFPTSISGETSTIGSINSIDVDVDVDLNVGARGEISGIKLFDPWDDNILGYHFEGPEPFTWATNYAVTHIDASVGGTIQVGNASVHVPENALTENKEITMSENTAVAPAGYRVVSPVYEIGPSGTTFSASVTITLPYDENAISGDVHEENLAIYYRADENSDWTYLGGTIDLDNNTISVEVNHFSEFVVMSKIAEQSPLALIAVLLVAVGIAGAASFFELRRRGFIFRREVPLMKTPGHCRKCGAPLSSGVKFCKTCGAGLLAPVPSLPLMKPAAFCRKCGSPLTLNVKFCRKCGAKR